MARRGESTTRARPYRPPAEAGVGLPCLEVVRGAARGHIVALAPGTAFVGRAEPNAVVLDCEGVSRRHARLSVAPDGMVTIFDLESTNGTFVNGARVSRAVLREGDRIDLGPDAALRFGYRSTETIEARVAAPSRARAAERPALPLSARELEIARLVADGLSNHEIGRSLFISARTVGTHLRNVYQRLEIHTRAELVRLILEHGLWPGKRRP
jgi:DNA-binding CsgD family transcriptional regulator